MNLPYQKHSETSRDAALQNTKSGTIRQCILLDLKRAGTKGLIADEILAMPEYKESHRVSTRLKELVDAGHAVKVKAKRHTRSKRLANIYKAKEHIRPCDEIANENKKKAAYELERENEVFKKALMRFNQLMHDRNHSKDNASELYRLIDS